MKNYVLRILQDTYSVASFPLETDYTSLIEPGSSFFACIYDEKELTIVCEQEKINYQDRIEPGWRLIRFEGILDFALVGIIARIATILAEANISIFTLSTYQTDYFLVKEEMLKVAISALKDADYQVIGV